ncbi:Response regulator receiver domain-containing protein [Neorhodopirellula lusitana]|uniref:Response regulator receiver domain-containing protein n=1 Tax=Neorhodopirellula lusitana TaxID=445327 RepID=A0ABY1QE10_9BACT|nr:response regulator [Neorhodopirellula lusitana]SMP68808.1 Response regulator receiver domain-containing protein [Neorhodopirellula lusitana]
MSLAQQLRILLVEPESVLADLTSFRLELLGYDIKIVSEGAQAKDWLRHESIDLLIVDTKLPHGDGIEWLTELRLEYKANESFPVLMLSLDPSLESVRRAYLAGAQDYLITPFDPTVLEEKIQNLVGGMLVS